MPSHRSRCLPPVFAEQTIQSSARERVGEFERVRLEFETAAVLAVAIIDPQKGDSLAAFRKSSNGEFGMDESLRSVP